MRNFRIEEYVDPDTYQRFGDNSIWFIDSRLIELMDNLRDLFGTPIRINDWLWGGIYKYRGFRPSDTYYHKTYSQHSFGRAVDFDVKGYTAKEARECILEWQKNGLLGTQDISLENKVSWVHLDIREHKKGIFTFDP